MPVFNRDKRYYTPGFVLTEDVLYYDGTAQFDKDGFEEKKKKYLKEATGNKI